jgi:hypothetical protein
MVARIISRSMLRMEVIAAAHQYTMRSKLNFVVLKEVALLILLKPLCFHRIKNQTQRQPILVIKTPETVQKVESFLKQCTVIFPARMSRPLTNLFIYSFVLSFFLSFFLPSASQLMEKSLQYFCNWGGFSIAIYSHNA